MTETIKIASVAPFSTMAANTPVNTMVIKNRRPTLPERGKIKIGSKGPVRKSQSGKDWQAPVKLDHFVITTLDRGADGNFLIDKEAHDLYGAEPKELPVRLLFNDPELNFATRYAAYAGKTVFCTGDGLTAQRTLGGKTSAVECPCNRLDKAYKEADKCKINGILSVLLDGMGGVGGIWKFRTTSFNSVDGLTASLHFMRQITGGQLAGIPLFLTVKPKLVADPDGKQQTIYVVGLEYRGNTDALREAGYKIALGNAQAGLRLDNIEAEAKRLPLPEFTGSVFYGEDAEVVQAEFYPQATKEQPPVQPPPPAGPTPAQGAAQGASTGPAKMPYPEMKAWVEKALADASAKGLPALDSAWQKIGEKLTRARGRGDINADQAEELDMLYQKAKQNLEGSTDAA